MRIIQRNRTGLLFILLSILGLLMIKGCGDSSTSPDDEEEGDQVSGIFYVRGKEVRTIYSDWPIPEGEVPSKDEERISFIIKIQKIRTGSDQLRIIGLEGADVGKYDNRIYPDCTIPEECKIYGNLVGEDLAIDIENNDRSYQATGKIYKTYEPYLEMTATYSYQNVKIEYTLEGVQKSRIEYFEWK